MRFYKLLADNSTLECSEQECYANLADLRHQNRLAVAVSKVCDNITVSTVFLGVDHSFEGGEPLIFETMVFDSNHSCFRYSTYDEALRGHGRVVQAVRDDYANKGG